MAPDGLEEKLKTLPAQPGVYVMKDSAQRILYVGKAKNLKSRVRSYFQSENGLSPKTLVLVKRIVDIEVTVTHTELEALLLECNLIKKHRPRYNIRLKDDKNYPYVVLDFTHPFPKFRTTRKVVVSPHLKYFGPFNGGVKEIARFLLKTFQIRDCTDQKFRNRTRPCLNYEIGICTAPCVNYVSEENYSKQIREAILFLKGKKQQLLQDLRREMKESSGKWDFEHAKAIRDKIESVEMITERQDAVLIDRQKDIDIIGRYDDGQVIQWVVLFIRSGLLTGRRSEKSPLTLDTIEDSTRTFLEQFYTVSLIPDEVWVSADFPDRGPLEELLTQQANKKVAIRVRRSEKPMRLLGMAYENAKLLLQSDSHRDTVSMSEALAKALDLKEPPHSIEGIDVSNLQSAHPVVALVHFQDEKPLKSRYRLYYPRNVEGQNDFAMIHEAITRRLKPGGDPPPDLFLIDGGRGQLQSAVKALEDVGQSIPICSIAKARTESAFTRKEINTSEERVFVPLRKNPLNLKEGNPALRLLQQVRDEVHRFAITSHRRKRDRSTLETSSLLDVHGIGEKSRTRLLQKLGSIDAVKAATADQLVEAGLNLRQATALSQAMRSEE